MQNKSIKHGCLLAGIAWVGVMIGVTIHAQGNDAGIWKLNVAKSTGTAIPPKSGTTKIEAVAAGTTVTVDQIQADGGTIHWTYTAKDDGKDSPITGNSPFGDMAARTRINATTVQTIFKNAGRVTATQTSVVSADGTTRTATTTGVNAAGQPVKAVVIFDR